MTFSFISSMQVPNQEIHVVTSLNRWFLYSLQWHALREDFSMKTVLELYVQCLQSPSICNILTLYLTFMTLTLAELKIK